MDQQLVLLASYPRSGSTLVRHVLESVYNTPAWTVYLGENVVLWPNRSVDHLDESLPVAFVKTHSLRDYDDFPHRTIYIVRDGRDAMLSQARFFTEYKNPSGLSFRDHLDALLDGHPVGKTPVSDWSEHVRTLWGAADARIRFEDLILDPVGVVTSALRQIGIAGLLPEPSGTVPSFEQLRGIQPAFYRKGTAGQWRDGFPAEWLDRFWDKHGKTMEMVGYPKHQEVLCPSV